MKKMRTLLFIVLAVVMCVPVFAAAPKLHATQELTFNLDAEPENLDPAKSTGVPEMNVELNTFEGLTRVGPNSAPIPGVAQKWTVSKDNLTYTFTLRKAAKWTNGDPVTASDFEYAWKRALNPATASEYAYQLYYLKNGEAYNTNKITDANQVGVKALDNSTLQVTLEAPCPYFLSICYFPLLAPVHKKTVEASPDKWATDPKTYISNGAFKMVSWTHQLKIIFEKNPYYWNKKNVKLTKLVFTLIEDQNTVLNMYDTNQVDIDRFLPNPELPRLEAEGALKLSPELGTYFYRFNTSKPPFNDVRVRKAFTFAVDRAALTKYVTKGGEKPALGYVPDGISDAKSGTDFRKLGGVFFKDADLKQAKQLLADAGYPDGKGFPEIQILHNTSATHKLIAEAIQEMWKKNLGVNVTIINQEWKVYLDSQDTLNYNVSRSGWLGDYVDPMTFMDMFVTKGGNNDTGWGNAKYDQFIDIAKNTGDQTVRMKAMHDAEKILMDEMPIMPIYFYTRPYLQKDWVQNVKKSALGFWDFSEAYITVH